MRDLLRSLALAFSFLAVSGGEAFAVDASHLCVVPVLDGEPTEADINQGWRMLSRVTEIPTSRYPAIQPLNRGGMWTLSQDRRFIPKPDGFPRGFDANSLTLETNSGRVLGFRGARSLYKLDPESGLFQPFLESEIGELGQLHHLIHIPRWRATVIGSTHGAFLLTGDELKPLPITNGQPIGSVYKFFDLPALKAIAIGTKDGRLLLRRDDGHLLPVLSLRRMDEDSKSWAKSIWNLMHNESWAYRKRDYLMAVHYLKDSNALIVITKTRLILIPLSSSGNGLMIGEPIVLDEKERGDEFATRWYIRAIRDFLAYRKN
jgi:hypothetical protein